MATELRKPTCGKTKGTETKKKENYAQTENIAKALVEHKLLSRREI
jgi:hypothetical protein